MLSTARPFYYLENFRSALAWLDQRYGDLLREEERAFIETLSRLPQASAGLLVRMIMRRGELFRVSQLEYPEIGASATALPSLIELAWVDPSPALTLRQLCELLRNEELQQAFELRRKPSGRRRHPLQLDFEFSEVESRPLQGWWKNAPDQVLHMRVRHLCERLRLMFFGNLHQDWSAFVLCDLGLRRYEKVPLDGTSRAFRAREQVDLLERLHALRELLRTGCCVTQVLSGVPPSLAENDWIEARRSQLLYRIGEKSEKLGALECALSAYESCCLPEARVRTIRVLERLGRAEEAVQRLAHSEGSSASELERQHAARMRPRLMRRLRASPLPTPTPLQGWHVFDLELPQAEPARAVERRVREQLRSDGSHVTYVENALINSLFGLLFWKAIYSPVAGAFFHPYQAAPFDLFDAQFVQRRRADVDDCFAQLADGRYRETLKRNHALKAGIFSPFVRWGRITAQLLQLAIDCIPPVHLHALFVRLLNDLRSNRTGLPDLVQFWPEERGYRMIEVKAPGDRLQDNQIGWLRYCVEHSIPVEVCRVRWSPATAAAHLGGGPADSRPTNRARAMPEPT